MSNIDISITPKYDPEAIREAAEEAARIFLTAFSESVLAASDAIEGFQEAAQEVLEEDNRPIQVGDLVRVLANPHYRGYWGVMENVSIKEGDVLEVKRINEEDGNLIVGEYSICVLPEYVERVTA